MFKKWEVLFLLAAFVSFMLANALYFGWIEGASKEDGIFVGHWVTSILVAATYLKLGLQATESKRQELTDWQARPSDDGASDRLSPSHSH